MDSFQSMPLAGQIKLALTNLKFTQATKIQMAAIPMALQGKDFMACAQTGSGKTAAYGIPMVNMLLEDDKKDALILAPTRELAFQIADFLQLLTAKCANMNIACLVGGTDMRKQLNALRRRVRIVVATPGRLTDHLQRRSVNLSSTKILVLDEGDRMLDMGFAPQLDVILKYLPRERQTSLFTATLPPKVSQLAEKYLNRPEKVIVGEISQPVEKIIQSVIATSPQEKNNKLMDELNRRTGSVIIFARTKRRTDLLAQSLKEFGFAVDHIHGGRTQGQRNQAIRGFKQGRFRILCATDIAARGLDIPQVEHVINYDLPMMEEDYVHRIGRTARNGANGEAVTFVLPEEHRDWAMIARKFKIAGVELPEIKGAKTSAMNKPKYFQRQRGGRPGSSRSGGGRSDSRSGGSNFRSGTSSSRNSGGNSSRRSSY